MIAVKAIADPALCWSMMLLSNPAGFLCGKSRARKSSRPLGLTRLFCRRTRRTSLLRHPAPHDDGTQFRPAGSFGVASLCHGPWRAPANNTNTFGWGSSCFAADTRSPIIRACRGVALLTGSTDPEAWKKYLRVPERDCEKELLYLWKFLVMRYF